MRTTVPGSGTSETAPTSCARISPPAKVPPAGFVPGSWMFTYAWPLNRPVRKAATVIPETSVASVKVWPNEPLVTPVGKPAAMKSILTGALVPAGTQQWMWAPDTPAVKPLNTRLLTVSSVWASLRMKVPLPVAVDAFGGTSCDPDSVTLQMVAPYIGPEI